MAESPASLPSESTAGAPSAGSESAEWAWEVGCALSATNMSGTLEDGFTVVGALDTVAAGSSDAGLLGLDAAAALAFGEGPLRAAALVAGGMLAGLAGLEAGVAFSGCGTRSVCGVTVGTGSSAGAGIVAAGLAIDFAANGNHCK